MNIRFLGTGYGECKAKKKILRDFRRSGGVLVDEKILFDCPQDISLAIQDLGFSELFSSIKHIIISHSHKGHFSPESVAKLSRAGEVTIYGSDAVLRMIPDVKNLIKVPIYPFEPVEILGYTLIPLPANHSNDETHEDTFNFILLSIDKALFYALDGGYINFDAFRVLKNITVDGVILECALGNEPQSERCISHNNFTQCVYTRNMLLASGIIKPTSRVILSHIPSDKKISIHDELAPLAKEAGMVLAYDGYFTLI
jgi:L-ascorbate metabolism protein UlaG (beta-lactamase superfamily)